MYLLALMVFFLVFYFADSNKIYSFAQIIQEGSI
jgi:hypothetical protein